VRNKIEKKGGETMQKLGKKEGRLCRTKRKEKRDRNFNAYSKFLRIFKML